MKTPLITGPFGLTLQWYLGLGTGFCICFIVNRFVCYFLSKQIEMKTFWTILYLLGISNPPNGYMECFNAHLPSFTPRIVCTIWKNDQWNRIYQQGDNMLQ